MSSIQIPPLVPQAGEISSLSFADNVGRIRLADGTEVRFGMTVLQRRGLGLVAAVGLRLIVKAVAPHPLGGFKATEVGPAESDAARNEAVDQEAAQIAERETHVRKAGPGMRTWTTLLRRAGVPRAEAAQILGLARPAARLVAIPAGRAVACGSSKFGGTPDLPPGFVWPRHADRPLAFLVQLRISELPIDVRSALALPADGLLSFFYDMKDQPWGFDPDADRGGAVLWLSRDLDHLAAVPAPDDLDPEWQLRELTVRVVEELRLPPIGTPRLDRLALDEGILAAYADALDSYVEMTALPHHLVGGHAMPIQDAMEGDCALNMHGLATGGVIDRSAPEVAAILQSAARLRLVLQIDTDDLIPVMWGDVGRLYVWMHKTDLHAHAFERAWCLLQCS